MWLKVIGSSSKGNCYLLDAGNEVLILEAGIQFKEIAKELGSRRLKKVVGCLVTHEHNDHSKSIADMVNNGITTIAIDSVWLSKNICMGSRSIIASFGKGYRLGGFKVAVFEAHHDVPTAGYVIYHHDMGTLLFLTDSYDCPVRIEGLNHIMIECNYSYKALDKAIDEGKTLAYQKERLFRSHMELETCKEFLRTSDLTNVKEVILLHLSERNSCSNEMIEEVNKVTGLPTYIALPGREFDLTK